MKPLPKDRKLTDARTGERGYILSQSKTVRILTHEKLAAIGYLAGDCRYEERGSRVRLSQDMRQCVYLQAPSQAPFTLFQI